MYKIVFEHIFKNAPIYRLLRQANAEMIARPFHGYLRIHFTSGNVSSLW